MKKIFRRLFIAAAVTFVVLSLFSCTTESVTDTSQLQYNREMISDVWIYDGSPNERIEKTINIDGTFQEVPLTFDLPVNVDEYGEEKGGPTECKILLRPFCVSYFD